jgi:hypothetical protein
MARRDDRAYPSAVCKEGATPPDGVFRENIPPGFWKWYQLRPQSTINTRTGWPRNFQTGSEKMLSYFKGEALSSCPS